VDARTWETAIPGVVAWEAELEAKLLAEIDRQLEAANELPREFTKPTSEETFAAALGAHSDACRAFGAAPVKESLAALTASEAAISVATGPGSRLHVAVMRRIVLAQLQAGALEEAATSAERLLVLLPNDELHALDRSQVEQMRQTALSNLPAAVRAVTAAPAEPLLKCEACASASRESEFRKAQKCPWCGAAWAPPN
jgi:hypothetical protein